ncbi:MAG: hypothetical protein A2075_11745 [Geobacteraceae bacterium GWC2_58_44]|nr:MAG: hypothetical protein A2075_11745 [Geobacteraceae bacterium GWC2_58_44]HBG08283.1 EAL domain-containing protein [Geobacter sp.]
MALRKEIRLGVPDIEQSFNDCGYLLQACKERLNSGGEVGIVALDFTRSRSASEISARYFSLLVKMIERELVAGIGGVYRAARGEYFLLLVPDIALYDADAFQKDQETIRRGLARQLAQQRHGKAALGFQLGGVFLTRRHEENEDNALFRALQELFTASSSPPARDQAERREIEEIIAGGLITPLFQPIVSLGDGAILGYEALSRMTRPGLLHNSEALFTKAVQYGLTAPLEMLCRRKAIIRARELELTGRLFLNVCPSLLLASDHQRGATAAFLDEMGLNRSDITFELTERTLIEDYELFRQVLSYYRGQGYSIAIDDLGSGYAGLKMLSELEPEYVKLSSYLIRGIDRSETKQAMVDALVTLCGRIGARVIAEGIESAQELGYLKKAGVGLGQGYFLARPSADP